MARRAPRPLSIKLAALTAGVTAATVGVAFWALSIETRATARTQLADQLGGSQRVLLSLERQNLEQLRAGASIVAQNTDVRSALETYREEATLGAGARPLLVRTVEDVLRHNAAMLNKELFIATDVRGRVFASATLHDAPPARGTDLSKLPALRGVLDPAASADTGNLSVVRLGTRYYQMGVVPIVLAGLTTGALLLGDPLDSAGARALSASFGGGVAIMSGDSVIASTLGAAERRGIVLADRSRSTPDGPAGVTTFAIAGDEYVVAALPLGTTQDGASVELRLLQPLAGRVSTLTRALAFDFLRYGLLAVLVAAIGAGLVSRAALSRLKSFVAHMRAAAGTEAAHERFAATDAPAEIQVLNESFDQLMDSLQRRRDQLEQRSAELAAANVVLTDEVRERERVQRALVDSEAQLRQSQKLEAIGTLAGGIAHDFNNLLTVISGFTQLALMRMDPAGPEAEDLKQVVDATGRAAHLTGQLLTFSRKQMLQPAVLDLNDVLAGVVPMLRRLIGEHIQLDIRPEVPLAHIHADRGQVEQVIVNLAVNARDAMPQGGSLTIATTNERPLAGADMEKGGTRSDPVVVLRVTDTGSGMSPETVERIFEPFFTTKEPGKGTGLGLSTVYGIVAQSRGHVDVRSALGEGTTFSISFPVVARQSQLDEVVGGHAVSPAPGGDELPRGSETVLLVEDEMNVRALARKTLEDCGYTVLAAPGPDDALEIARRHRDVGPIDLILTDIVMPRMSGPQFVERYLAFMPAATVMYMSGYADEAVLQFEIEPGTAFLRKPFSPQTLARFVREALDATSRAPVLQRGTS